MDDLEQKIQSVLSDPAQMAQVLEMAKSLGITLPKPDAAPAEAPEPPDAPEAAPQPEPPKPDAPPPTLPGGGLAQRQEALLRALEPFLRPARREKIERALQIARLTNLAGGALRKKQPGTRDAR